MLNHLEILEGRALLSADPSVDTVVIFGTGGNDNISVSVTEYVDTRSVSWTVNGVNHSRNSPFFEKIVIVDFGGNDHYELMSGPIGVSYSVTDMAGNDTMDVWTYVRGRVTFAAGGGTDYVSVGRYAAQAEQVSVGAGRVEFGPYGWVQTANVENLTLLGSSRADTIDIGQVSASQRLNVRAGGGDDVVRIGRGDVESNVFGQVGIFGDSGTDRVIFDDATDTGNDAYRFEPSRMIKPGRMNHAIWAHTEKMELQASNGSNRIDVFATGGLDELWIAGRGGNDTLNLGRGDLDEQAGTKVHFNGGYGTDRLVVDDHNDGVNRSHDLLADSYWRGGVKRATFAEVNAFEIRAGRGHDTIHAQSAMTGVSIDGGAGNDIIRGSGYADLLRGGSGDDSIFGNAGNDTLWGEAGNDLLDGGPGEDVKFD